MHPGLSEVCEPFPGSCGRENLESCYFNQIEYKVRKQGQRVEAMLSEMLAMRGKK